ncbi:FAD:protein FMN transferase [Sporolactobacillus kofuensis]|uniref:FAD:protein FMN transferase n=1 Tax=Sporolactobacillus kofuensis TaxID=269672 RepID=A0ABW1WEV2_9BACL|nr:FAD:protein FMN transferase [Sporolactobacillus kofuensis]MCO7175142.1 FAD:protein FMN transferase [Sporolactobacillus kofuensis]
MPKFHRHQMNTLVSTSRLTAPDAGNVFEWMSVVENQFSRFLPKSELSQINRKAGSVTPLSRSFAELLFEALRYYSATEGIFNPFLGRLMNAFGYDRSFDQLDRENAMIFGIKQKCQVPIGSFSFDLDRREVHLPTGSALDFGGIAKGWAVQKAALRLIASNRSAGLINAGGDLMCWRAPSDPTQWVINVSHPHSEDQTIGQLVFDPGQWGVATSSKVKRRWHDGKSTWHHILDPRTSLPSDSDIVQATVIGDALLPCEIYAKCLLIMGTQDGPDWLYKRRPDLLYLIIKNNGQVMYSSQLRSSHILRNFSEKITMPI